MLEGMGRFRTQLHRTADARPSGVAPTAAVRLPAARSVRAEWRLPRLDARRAARTHPAPARLGQRRGRAFPAGGEGRARARHSGDVERRVAGLPRRAGRMGQARDRGTALSRSAVRAAAGVGFSARSVQLRRHKASSTAKSRLPGSSRTNSSGLSGVGWNGWSRRRRRLARRPCTCWMSTAATSIRCSRRARRRTWPR